MEDGGEKVTTTISETEIFNRMGLTDERKTNNNKTVQKTTGDGNTDGQTGGNTGSGSGEGTKTNANWPDFSKLTRVQDVLDRNKCVWVMFCRCGAGGRDGDVEAAPRSRDTF